MLGRLLKLRRRKGSYKSYEDYYKEYERAKRENPERFEQEQEIVRKWVLRIVKRRQQQSALNEETLSAPTITKPEEAMEKMREIARAAFMRHPAATEADFRICWPAIRVEMLKQYTLEELAAQPERMSALLLKAASAQAELPRDPQLALEHRNDTRAFLQAVRDGNIHDVNVFLLSGVDVNVMIDGWTALMVATIKGYGEIGRALLNRHADANIKNNDGLTALRFAVAMGDIEMMQLLLSKGADVNTLDNRWWTPMMQAADENSIEGVKILLARGADLNIRNKDGDTALSLAESKNHKVIIHLLKRAGAVV
jgi:Ankyrin repeats (3 copies)/Ankyrin repeats (many copies)